VANAAVKRRKEGLSKALLCHPPYRLRIAKHYEMPTILNSLKAATSDLSKEGVSPAKAFHVPDLPFDYTAALGFLSRENLRQPEFRCQIVGKLCHA
jgi:hypothetical protein